MALVATRSRAGGATALAVGLAAAAYVGAVNPSHPGPMPTLSCPFHAATGLWCPGCGMTRAMHAALTGHPLRAFGENVFWPVVVIVAIWALLAWCSPRMPRVSRVPLAGWLSVVGLAIVYAVLRNIPTFSALAP
jgi:hypothetical protein